MQYIDLHCDTLMWTWREEEGDDIYANDRYGVDLTRLVANGALAQFFAIFMLREEDFDQLGRPLLSDWDYIHSLASQLQRGIDRSQGQVKLVHGLEDYQNNVQEGVLSAFLTIEDGRMIESLDDLEDLKRLGIRLISLTWNYENSLGYPNSTDPAIMGSGLKPLGKEVVEAMNHWGMIVDVSHLSDGGFQDVLDISQQPFMASHSNCRALSKHPRNLTDAMIRQLADQGGVMGLNFCPAFLHPDIQARQSRIQDMVRHLNHARNVGGIEVLALGTDFEGIEGDLEIGRTEDLVNLFEALGAVGWSSEEIEKFAYQNADRFIQDVLKG